MEPKRNQSAAYVLVIPFVIFTLAIVGMISRREPTNVVYQVSGGDPAQGPDAFQHYGCGSCHTIRGVVGADGRVGPALDNLTRQSYIAGHLPNTAENLVRFIQDPQSVSPGNAMPNLGVTEPAARDMAAYLYNIR